MEEIVGKLREKLEDPQGDFPSMIVLGTESLYDGI